MYAPALERFWCQCVTRAFQSNTGVLSAHSNRRVALACMISFVVQWHAGSSLISREFLSMLLMTLHDTAPLPAVVLHQQVQRYAAIENLGYSSARESFCL